MTRKLADLTNQDADWLRKTFTGDEYWHLYFFNKVALQMVDLSPDVHLLYCEFLDDPRNHYKLAMMPRDFVKSWILRGKAIRDYLRDNNVRILIAMATEELSRNASEQMANIMTRNALIRFLFPDMTPQEGSDDRWTSKSRTLPRTIDAPEPTWQYAGVKTELVSGHYDKIFLDDVFAKEAADSLEVANKVFSFNAACEPLLNDPATSEVIQVCTRWAMDDLAAKIMGESKQETDALVFRADGDPRYVCLKRSAIEDNKAIWPERFPIDVLADKERGFANQGLAHYFAFQYLNNPIDARVVEFPQPQYWERIGDFALKLFKRDGTTVIVDERDLYRTMTIDPAYTGKKRADDSAVCIMGSHPEGYRINLLSTVERLPIDKFVEKIVDVVFSAAARGLPLARVGIETNAQQLATRQYIQEIARKRNVYIPWHDIHVGTVNSKQHRIRQMIPLVAEGMYFTHASFMAANKEMQIFPASKKDNWLDAFAHQPQLWGVASREQVQEEDVVPWKIDEYEPESVSRGQRPVGYGG